MSKNKVVKLPFNDEEKEFKFSMPSLKDKREAKKVYNRAFREATNSGAMIRDKARLLMEEQGIWNEEKNREYQQLMQDIAQAEFTLLTGLDYTSKKKVYLKQARKTALELRNKLRPKLAELLSVGKELDSKTADAQAENEEFNYYISACVVYNDVSKRVFSSYEEYVSKSEETDVYRLAQAYADFYYDLDSLNLDDRLPEERFLKDWKFVDKNGRLVNEEGKFVDLDGNIIETSELETLELPKQAVFLNDDDSEVSLNIEEENNKEEEIVAEEKV